MAFSAEQRSSCHLGTPSLPRTLRVGRSLLAGPFDGMAHTTALLDRSMDRAVRGCLLRLVEAVLSPEGAQQDERARRGAAANGRAFVQAGGVQLAVDLVAGLSYSLITPFVSRNFATCAHYHCNAGDTLHHIILFVMN